MIVQHLHQLRRFTGEHPSFHALHGSTFLIVLINLNELNQATRVRVILAANAENGKTWLPEVGSPMGLDGLVLLVASSPVAHLEVNLWVPATTTNRRNHEALFANYVKSGYNGNQLALSEVPVPMSNQDRESGKVFRTSCPFWQSILDRHYPSSWTIWGRPIMRSGNYDTPKLRQD